jgi:hypothetical protein
MTATQAGKAPMRNTLAIIIFLTLLPGAQIVAQESKTGPSSLKMRGGMSNPATKGASQDMQKLVALCARDPESQLFDREWAKYLQEYYRDGMNVDGLIEDVIQRADDYRMNSHQASGNLTMSAAEKRSIRRNMKSTAQAVVGKKKDPAG